jgi:hypothetical protein
MTNTRSRKVLSPGDLRRPGRKSPWIEDAEQPSFDPPRNGRSAHVGHLHRPRVLLRPDLELCGLSMSGAGTLSVTLTLALRAPVVYEIIEKLMT